MPLIVVTSQESGAGKTGVAAAIARHFAYTGVAVTLARAASDVVASRAGDDAAYFGSLGFAPGTASAVTSGPISPPDGEGLLVAEADLAEAAAIADATATVLVCRNAVPAALPAGVSPSAIVVTDAPHQSAASVVEGPNGVPVILLGEDRCLAGFTVSEARAAINAEVLVVGDNGDPTCDHLVISPITSDAGQPYFRRFGSKAVVVRFDKTDMHLAAMKAEPECLILTGGRRPSDYLFDAASASGIPVLLSRTDTENTVIALEGIFDRTRFQGDRKLDRMAELLESTSLFETLAL
ncbi:MAG: DRTGG domain-containing protein [Tepidiformaceae bacterium]